MAKATALATLLLATAFGAPPARAEVLVLVNEWSPVSVAIGEYYRTRHGLPPSSVVRLRVGKGEPDLSTAGHEAIGRKAFERQILGPVERYLEAQGLRDRVRVLVVAKGVPLLVGGGGRVPPETILRDASWAAVDAELALAGSGMAGRPGALPNPYFGSELSFDAFRRAHPEAPLRCLVGRLTGYQTEVDPETGVPRDVKQLIDRAVAPDTSSPSNVWLVDEDPSQRPGRLAGNPGLLRPSASMLRALGLRVVHETTPAVAADVPHLAGFTSWGSNAREAREVPFYGDVGGRRVPGHFAARAIAVPIVSSNGRSFTHPPRYGQSLAADLVRMGAAGVAAHVREPLLGAVARPQIVLWRYARGATAAEAFFAGIPYLGWANFWVGDPSMRMEAPAAMTTRDLDGDGVADRDDNCTELPNPDQRDTDGDDFGNPCDGDVDGDGTVTTSWGQLPAGDLERIAVTAHTGAYHPDHDLDGDGDVDADDASLASFRLLLPPGPSGRAAARSPAD